MPPMTTRASAPPPRGGANVELSGRASKTGGYRPHVSSPLLPIVAIGACAVLAIVLTLVGWSGGAGSTESISGVALAAWVIGSVGGLVCFSWFRSIDVGRRAEPRYIEPAWRPRTVAVWVTLIGWAAGSFGALMVAQAVARR
jgi:hypothetical protein